MKKLIIITLLLLLAFPAGVLADANKINIETVFIEIEVAASATVKSAAINLSTLFRPNGFFSLQVTATGTGTAKITYELSNDGVTYVTPDSASDIVTAQTAANDFYSFAPELAKFMKIVLEETGTSNSIVITAILGVQ